MLVLYEYTAPYDNRYIKFGVHAFNTAQQRWVAIMSDACAERPYIQNKLNLGELTPTNNFTFHNSKLISKVDMLTKAEVILLCSK